MRGEAPNLALLERQLVQEYGDAITIRRRDLEQQDDLRHADLVELVISFGLGVLGNATYDGIRALIGRAQTRGSVAVEEEPPDQAGDHEPERSD